MHVDTTSAIDPVCGMTVDPVKAKGTAEHGGQTYYFCSPFCVHKFKADPEGVLKAGPRSMSAAPSGMVQLGGTKPAGNIVQIGAPAPKASGVSQPSPSGEDVTAPVKTERFYVCPMCPEVREKSPVACPSCGMALEPELTFAPSTRTEYVCPMHPEIVRDEPGACPICGMALEPHDRHRRRKKPIPNCAT